MKAEMKAKRRRQQDGCEQGLTEAHLHDGGYNFNDEYQDGEVETKPKKLAKQGLLQF